MSDTLTIQSPSEILYKRILIAMLADKREKKLAYMAGWRERNPDAKMRWDNNHKDHATQYRKDYIANHERKLHIKANMRVWRENNSEAIKANKARWKKNNPEKFRAMSLKAARTGCSRHPHMAMRKRIKASIGIYLQRIGGTKANRTCENIIGCDMRFFAKWIESQFLPGMNFENRSLWHLDHIFPNACCGSNQQQLLLAQNYRNLRPLWKGSNRDKWCHLSEESLVAGFLCGLNEIHLTKHGQASMDIVEKAKRIGFSIYEETQECAA